MSTDAISLDIPGSTLRYGVGSQFDDYAVRRHLVKGQSSQTAALTALYAELVTWDEHHVIPNLPLQTEQVSKFGRDQWIVEHVFSRRRTSGYRSASNGKRQEIRLHAHAVPVFIKADASRTNGLPYDANPDPEDFFLLPLSGGVQSSSLPPASWQYLRPAMRITDQRTYDVYPLTAGQIGCLNKVNNGTITLNSVGLSFSAHEVLFMGADFVMESDGTASTGRWAGAYYFDAIKGGHYMQRAYWSAGSSKWLVANALQYDTADFAANF